MNFHPEIVGKHPIHSDRFHFVDAIQQRVKVGFFSGQSGPRQCYEFVDRDRDTVSIRAKNWWTAINVGLNDLLLDFTESGTVRFRLRYWRWAIYCIVLCASLGLAGFATFLAIDIRQFIANNANARIPGLTVDQNVIFAWCNVFFWGFIWPWILIVCHKRPLRKLLARIIAETDAIAMDNTTNAG